MPEYSNEHMTKFVVSANKTVPEFIIPANKPVPEFIIPANKPVTEFTYPSNKLVSQSIHANKPVPEFTIPDKPVTEFKPQVDETGKPRDEFSNVKNESSTKNQRPVNSNVIINVPDLDDGQWNTVEQSVNLVFKNESSI